MYLISIDPHLPSKQFPNDCTLAMSVSEGTKLTFVAMVGIKELFAGQVVTLTNDLDRHLVLEGQYAGGNREYGIKLARLCGRIEQYFISLGFQTHIAPVFGTAGWQAQMLGWRGRVPGREQAKKLSLMRAKQEWPNIEFENDHLSDAALMGLWWLGKEKENSLCNKQKLNT